MHNPREKVRNKRVAGILGEGIQKIEDLERLIEGEASLCCFQPLNDEIPKRYPVYEFEADEDDKEFDDRRARMV